MITVLRLQWTTVDDTQWSVLQTMLNTELLAPHGCLSWHSRRDGRQVRVTATWDSQYGAQQFADGRLVEVVRALDLDLPERSRSPIRGLHYAGQRPTLAQAA